MALDEALYSRQLYVLGSDAMQAFTTSSVLILGTTGLGQEISKNIILAGINKVILYDPRKVKIEDLGSGFYFTIESVGKRRDFEILNRMKELNPYVDVSILEFKEFNEQDFLSDDFLNYISQIPFTLIISTGFSFKEVSKLSNLNSYFISAQCDGLFSSVFCDFKDNFVVNDDNGENILTGLINDVDEDGIMTMIDGERHNLENNKMIKIYKHDEDSKKEVLAYKIIVLDSYRVKLQNYKGEAFSGGSFEEVKVKQSINFKRLSDVNFNDILDIGDIKKNKIMHEIYKIKNESDFFGEYDQINDSKNELLAKTFHCMQNKELIPMVSIVGGFVAQEAIKACSNKFTPLQQLMYFDSIDCLKNESFKNEDENDYKFLNFYLEDRKKRPENFLPQNLRYDDYIEVFGIDNFKKFTKSSCFIVGAGAIGCEHLKNLVMSGIGVENKIYVTDMDSIEQSNLNRQFLFRQNDVRKMKAEVAAREVKKMNNDYCKKIKIDTNENEENKIIFYNLKVGFETEDIFSDKFYEKITFVANALDNIEARNYVDSRIILNEKPLFESGTLGTKGNTQVIIPHKTESYSSSIDPPEKSIPLCTLRNFPNLIEHTIEYALSEFKNHFSDKIICIKKYIAKETVENMEDIEENIKSLPLTKEDLFNASFNLFYHLFYTNIKKLLIVFPEGHITNEGLPFWAPPKRAPIVVEYNSENKNHLLFVFSCAKLMNECYGINQDFNEKDVKDFFFINKEKIRLRADDIVDKMKVDKNQKIEIDAEGNIKNNNEEDIEMKESNLTSTQSSLNVPEHYYKNLFPIEFEKDDDKNFHIDFIYSCANIRAQNYKIKEGTRLQVKGIAGKIIPAIATTTALISGLSVLEMYKYVLNCHFSAFKNTYVTLALPLIASSEPFEPVKNDYFFINENEKNEFTLWDRLEFKDMTLNEFKLKIREKYDCDVQMITIGGRTIYCSFFSPERYDENMNKKFSEIANVGKGMKFIVLGVMYDSESEYMPYTIIRL